MATLERIRKKGGVLVAFVIGLALFAFILTDFFKKSGNQKPEGIEVGVVNSTTITYADYQNEFNQAEEFTKLRTRQNSVDENTQYQLREQAWTQLVSNIILGEKYENTGIDVTDAEVIDMATGKNVHPIIRQMFSNPQTGQFDQTMVVNFLRNRKSSAESEFFWNYIKKIMVTQKLQTKYNTLFKQGFYPTKSQIESEVKSSQRSVDFDFIAVPFSSIPDSTLNISQSAIEEYYNKHKDNFKQDEERTVEYVSFDVNPSEEDKELAEKWVEDLKDEFSASKTDAAQFVNMNSDIPYADKNLKADELRIAIKDFVTNAKEGDVYGPYLDDNTYKISRVVSIKQMPDSVRARHILLQEKTQAEANHVADSLIALIDKGADFADLARKYSADKNSAINGGDLNWFKEGTMVKPFNDACFNAKKGDILKVETQYGVHIINIQDLGKTVTKYNVATLAREIKYSTKTYQQVYAEANKFAANNNSADKFKSAIKTEKLTPRYADLKTTTRTVNGMDGSRRLVQWAFEANVNDLSPTIYEFGNKFVIAILTGKSEKGYRAVSSKEVINSIRPILARDIQAEKIMAKIKENAATSQSLTSLAQKMDVNVQTATDINFASYQVPGVGQESALIGLATTAEVGKISAPVQGNRFVFVVKVNSESTTDGTNADQIKAQLTQSNGYKVDYRLDASIQEKADITDARIKYF